MKAAKDKFCLAFLSLGIILASAHIFLCAPTPCGNPVSETSAVIMQLMY